MLTHPEIYLFLTVLALSLIFTARGVITIITNIKAAHGTPNLTQALHRAPSAIWAMVSLQRTFKTRPVSTMLHAAIAWGFILFIFVNINDLVVAFFGYRAMDSLGLIGDLVRTLVDLFNALILVGMAAMMVRRFVTQPTIFTAKPETGLLEVAKWGIQRDSVIVGSFILFHNGARLLGEAAFIASSPEKVDHFQIIGSTLARLFVNVDIATLTVLEHAGFWCSMGAILAFLPYFPKSKHIHLFFVPIAHALKSPKTSLTQYPNLDLEDESLSQYGAESLADLPYGQILDAYACIMCFRCQDACPAYASGKPLSPATLEINKRYALNSGDSPEKIKLLDLIPYDAVWSCTTCGACVDICPVGNEPLIDIIEIRRNLSMMESNFPRQLETAFKGMERNANPWNVAPALREKWAEGLIVPTIETNPEPDVLWWVGCAPATDPRAQRSARAFAEVLAEGGVNYAILGKQESCTGDSARRAGREDIYYQLAGKNIETLNEVAPKLIVTTCPHCMHTLANEYPELGGHYKVIHHTQLINQLIGQGKIQLDRNANKRSVTFHDPCYLGRHNGQVNTPREILANSKSKLNEMVHYGTNAQCCGAGGSQFWKEETGTARNNLNRYKEAKATSAEDLIVGCPFCLTMLGDAAKNDEMAMSVTDIAEFVAQNMIRK